MKLHQAVSTFAGLLLASEVFAGQSLGASLGATLGGALGASLPIAAGGTLLVAGASLAFGISMIQRKRIQARNKDEDNNVQD